MSRKRGFFGIGCIGMKTPENYGMLFRTAHIFKADFIYLIGARFTRSGTDTTHASRHVPLYTYKDFDDFNQHRPIGSSLVGIELHKSAIPLERFCHPKAAIYLLGAEDSGIPEEAIKHCDNIVILPGEQSLNVAVAGSIVLYDRIAKASRP